MGKKRNKYRILVGKPEGKRPLGIISCDFFGAYRKFERMTGALLQLCWAHFIREALFLLKEEDEAVREAAYQADTADV
jgi:hypothetical protein